MRSLRKLDVEPLLAFGEHSGSGVIFPLFKVLMSGTGARLPWKFFGSIKLKPSLATGPMQ